MSNKDADAKFLQLRKSGWKGPIDHKGNAVMTRTDKHGNPVPLFKNPSKGGKK
jgi:hypothetical protein